jgi:hypothetical protein
MMVTTVPPSASPPVGSIEVSSGGAYWMKFGAS